MLIRREGSILDLLLVMILITCAVIGWMFGAMLWGEIMPELNTTLGAYNVSSMNNILNSTTQTEFALIDTIPFLFFGMLLATVALAAMIPTRPVFFPIAIMLSVIMIYLGSVFANVMWAFINEASFIPIASAHPVVVTIIQYLPQIIGVFCILLCVVMYSRAGQE